MSRQGTLGLAALAVAFTMFVAAMPARAGRNDLKLTNLCPQVSVTGLEALDCAWITRDSNGMIQRIAPTAQGLSDFRSLMSELGVVMAPRIPMPANTLGFAGFQVDGQLSFTQISNGRGFWNGVNAVSPVNPSSSRPDSMLTTVGLFARKGLWVPLPSFEVGGGVVNLVNSQMLSWQAYAKLALHEGFHDLPIPALAVRAAVAYLTGTDQANLTTTSLDVFISKGFGFLKTTRLEPFGGYSFLLIKASGKPVDFTPLCDAEALAQATQGQAVGKQCANGQRGSTNDLSANYAFPAEAAITRNRLFGGAKLKFGVLAIIAEYDLYLAGKSRDDNVTPVVDQSGQQSALSLSAGLDF